jgi:hypothetical protein
VVVLLQETVTVAFCEGVGVGEGVGVAVGAGVAVGLGADVGGDVSGGVAVGVGVALVDDLRNILIVRIVSESSTAR